MPRRCLILFGFLLLTSSAPAQVSTSERYYMLLFGGQANVLRPRTAHTWATYVRVTPQANGTARLEQFTISWLPADLKIQPWKLRPEPGMNLDLYQTLEFMSGGLGHISLWGPFEVKESHYRQALHHRQELDSGAYQYRVLDLNRLNPNVLHCVHAVTRSGSRFEQATPPIVWFGEFGTAPVAAALIRSGVTINPRVTHDWLLPALGLDGQQFIRRRYGTFFPITRH